MGFGLVSQFIGYSLVITTIRYNTLKITVTLTHEITSSTLQLFSCLLNSLCLTACLTHNSSTPSFVKVKVTLRLTVRQSVSLGVEPHLGLMPRYLLLFDSYGLVFVGHTL
jgi:hypothetical protein